MLLILLIGVLDHINMLHDEKVITSLGEIMMTKIKQVGERQQINRCFHVPRYTWQTNNLPLVVLHLQP